MVASTAKKTSSAAIDELIQGQSVLARIINRLAGLTPDQYIPPAAKRGPDANVVGVANDHLRRLLTLSSMLAHEHNVKVPEVRTLRRQIDQAFSGPGSFFDRLRHIFNSGVDAGLVDRCEEAEDDLRLKCKEQELVSALFWLEVRSAFSKELRGKPAITIYDDWSIAWTEHDNGDDIFEMMFGGDMPPELKEFFEGLGGHARPRHAPVH